MFGSGIPTVPARLDPRQLDGSTSEEGLQPEQCGVATLAMENGYPGTGGSEPPGWDDPCAGLGDAPAALNE